MANFDGADILHSLGIDTGTARVRGATIRLRAMRRPELVVHIQLDAAAVDAIAQRFDRYEIQPKGEG